MTRATLQKQIANFQKVARGVLSRIATEFDQSAPFAPSHFKGQRLKALGIEGNLPAICAKIRLHPTTKLNLKLNLIKLAHTKIDKSAKAIADGQQKVLLKRLDLKGRVNWDNNLKPCPCLLNDDPIFQAAAVQYVALMVAPNNAGGVSNPPPE